MFPKDWSVSVHKNANNLMRAVHEWCSLFLKVFFSKTENFLLASNDCKQIKFKNGYCLDSYPTFLDGSLKIQHQMLPWHPIQCLESVFVHTLSFFFLS